MSNKSTWNAPLGVFCSKATHALPIQNECATVRWSVGCTDIWNRVGWECASMKFVDCVAHYTWKFTYQKVGRMGMFDVFFLSFVFDGAPMSYNLHLSNNRWSERLQYGTSAWFSHNSQLKHRVASNSISIKKKRCDHIVITKFEYRYVDVRQHYWEHPIER